MLPVEITEVVRAALLNVVEQGTALRLAGGLHPAEGITIPVGGKTGTGDHRMEMFDAAGRVVSERVMNRTATFVFFIGDRFYGTVSAYVPGRRCGQILVHEFTARGTAPAAGTPVATADFGLNRATA